MSFFERIRQFFSRFVRKQKKKKIIKDWFGKIEDYREVVEKVLVEPVISFKRVEKDERGEVYSVTTESGREAFISYTVKNEVRGGYSHPATHHVFVIKGRVMWTCKICTTCPPEQGIEDHVIYAQDLINTLKDTPHMVISLGEPSVILEWLDQPEYEQKPFPEFREQVEAPL